jgi:hypothetical protein
MTDTGNDGDSFVLPASIVTKVDLSRMVSEFEQIDNELTTASVRERSGGAAGDSPSISEQFSDFLAVNQLDISDARARGDMIKRLRKLKDTVPVLHMTFSATADGESLRRLSAWIRESIHPQAVIAVGLQPALIGGVYVRTPNHVMDLSLRSRLKEGHGLITNELEALRGSR